MRTTRIPLLIVALLGVSPARADEIPAKSKIVAVDLFKNGLAVIRREVTLGKPGVYALDDVPEPVHGTYWVESTAPVETTVQTREVEVASDEAVPGSLQEDLAGRSVKVHFKGDKQGPVTGTVVRFKPPSTGEGSGRESGENMAQRFLVLQTSSGRLYVEASEIAFVMVDNADAKVRRRKSRLLLTLGTTDKPETRVAVTYLAHGLSWAPAYKIDISDPKTLTLEQQAVVRNELADLDGAEVRLISGFPSIQFPNVVSPLSARTNWANFLQQIALGSRATPDWASNGQILMQGAVGNSLSPVWPGIGAAPAGEGVDLHYQPIGRRTLARGDALSLSVAKGKADYERIVEWSVADARDEWGRYTEGRGRDDGDDAAWDALRFRNPLSFPMTTGPALVTAGGRFNGQRTSHWANTGEETLVRVDKALSIRTRSTEHEQRTSPDENREIVWVGGRQFRRATVEGELAIGNHRAETVRLMIRRRFSGELLEAEGKPKTALSEEGIYSINRRSELLWDVSLKPGEDRVLKYRYKVLVAN